MADFKAFLQKMYNMKVWREIILSVKSRKGVKLSVASAQCSQTQS